jgi:hypothetical protein
MINALRKGWRHIFIWALMLAYFAFAPDLFVRFILKDGKPIQYDEVLPDVSDQISYSITRLETFYINGELFFKLIGWSFLRSDPNQAMYERLIVLKSDTNTYFFAIQSTERPDVQEAFEYLDIDLLNSGFSSLLSKDVIRPGIYRIGIVFRIPSANKVYYMVTNKIIVRTANQIRLDNYKPSGEPIPFEYGLPNATDQIQASIDRLEPYNSTDKDLFTLLGWSIFIGDPNQSVYERFIVLHSNNNIYFFPIQSSKRPDVQEYFNYLHMDLLNSGFSTTLSKDSIIVGDYQIGIVYKHHSSNAVYYFLSNRVITRTKVLLELVP